MNARALGLIVAMSAAACGAPQDAGTDGFTPGGRVVAMKKNAAPHAAFAGPKLVYYGGHVIPHSNVIAVFWGPNVDPVTVQGIGDFYAAVGDSPHLDWLSEYDTDVTAQDGSPGTNQHIGRGTFGGAYTITPSTSATTIDDTKVQSELEAQITAGHLPPPDENTLYMTYFAPGVTITESGDSSCQAFCAYHGTFHHGRSAAVYGVIPDQGGACASGCADSGDRFSDVTAVSSHEWIESVTDAEVGFVSGNTSAAPLAWNDDTNGEIGDICVAQIDQIAGYTVQKEWSNSLQQCITFNPAVPPPTPTPSPSPTATPGVTPTPDPGNGADGIAGGCGCDLGDTSGAMPIGTAVMLGALSLYLLGRRTNRN